MQTEISVVKVVERWDMRGRHKLREGRAAQTLRARQCIVAFNKQETIAMIIDSSGGVYYAYEPDGFDLRILAREIRKGLAVVLVDRTKTAQTGGGIGRRSLSKAA